MTNVTYRSRGLEILSTSNYITTENDLNNRTTYRLDPLKEYVGSSTQRVQSLHPLIAHKPTLRILKLCSQAQYLARKHCGGRKNHIKFHYEVVYTKTCEKCSQTRYFGQIFYRDGKHHTSLLWIFTNNILELSKTSCQFIVSTISTIYCAPIPIPVSRLNFLK